MNSLLNRFLLLVLLFVLTTANGQVLETKRYAGVSGGVGLFSGVNDNLFFPKSDYQSSINVHLELGHKIINGLEGGILLSYFQLSDFDHFDGAIQRISADNGKGFAIGPFLKLKTPFQPSGFFNQAGFGVLVAPEYFELSEDRKLNVDNEVHWIDGPRQQVAMESAGDYSGIAWQIVPEFSYQLTQSTGLRLSWFNQLMTLDTGYDSGVVLNMGVSIGVRYHFGYYKHLF